MTRPGGGTALCACGCGGTVVAKDSRFIRGHQNKIFTPDELARLRREYLLFRDAGKIADLAANMGRPKHSICRQARVLGLTDPSHARPYVAVWKYLSPSAAAAIWDDFKASSLGLRQYCNGKRYDDLGFARTMKEHFGDEWDHVIELKTPATSKYRLGRALEYRVRDAFRGKGYFVLRSPASRSPLDLVAIKPGRVIFVQCKRGGAIGVAEWNEFYELCESCGAEPLLASTPTGRGTVYHRMIGRKDGSRARQPMRPWSLDLEAVDSSGEELVAMP